MTTLNQINKAIKVAGYKAELFKGEGYFYFSGHDVDLLDDLGVYGVFHLSDYTIEQWVEELKQKLVN